MLSFDTLHMNGNEQSLVSVFHTVRGVLKARILKWFVIPFPVDHVLSELSITTRLPCVALHGMAHSFTELDKAVVYAIRLVSFL